MVVPMVALGSPAAAIRADESPRSSTVGVSVRIEQLVLPGSELAARPIDDRKLPLVLRIVAAYPHGTAFRYDLEYYALEPGAFDLRDYLVRKDASPVDDLPPLAVEARSLLPAGQILPHELTAGATPWLGGYRALLVAAFVAWLVGLGVIMLARRRAAGKAGRAAAPPPTLAERLEPLIQQAMHGTLDPRGRAELERLLLTYWRRRLDWQDMDPAAAITRLREHEEAGVLLRQVEAWLHKPEGRDDVDVAAILAPYRKLSADEPATGRHEQLLTGGAGGPA